MPETIECLFIFPERFTLTKFVPVLPRVGEMVTVTHEKKWYTCHVRIVVHDLDHGVYRIHLASS